MGAEDAAMGLRDLFLELVASKRLRTKQNKVGLCRFYQLLRELRDFMPDWTAMLMHVLLVSIEEKWMQKTSWSQLVGKVKPDMSGAAKAGDEKKKQTNQSTLEEIRALRSACRSAMELTATALSEPVNHRLATLICILPIPADRWYSEQARVLRSADEALDWFAAQASGAFWTQIHDTFNQLKAPHILEQLGFKINLSAEDMLYTPESCDVQEDVYMSKLCGRFCSSMAWRRTTRCSWMLFGYLGLCVLRLGPDSEVALRKLKAACEAFLDSDAQNTILAQGRAREPFSQGIGVADRPRLAGFRMCFD